METTASKRKNWPSRFFGIFYILLKDVYQAVLSDWKNAATFDTGWKKGWQGWALANFEIINTIGQSDDHTSLSKDYVENCAVSAIDG